MSILKGIGKLTGSALRLGVGIPASIIKDIATMGGVTIDESPSTFNQLKKISEDFEEGIKELGED